MNQSSKIYVAGHLGMVGSALIRTLVHQGYGNIIVQSQNQLDLRNQHAVQNFFAQEKPGYVFLAAAKVGGIVANNTYRAEFIYDNLMIATNVIHAAYEHGVTKLLNLGSSCIYPKYAPQPMKEEYLLSGPLESTNEPYAIAKIAAIKLCRYYNEQYHTNFISLMPTNLYGPFDNFDPMTSHVIPGLIQKFHHAKITGADQVVVWGTGKPYREFLHVDDLAQAAIFVMQNYDYDAVGECVNVGSGIDIAIADLVQLAKTVVGFSGRVVYDTQKPDGTPKKLLDISRINALGWKAQIGLIEGIRQVYEWYLENQVPSVNTNPTLNAVCARPEE